MSDDPRPNAESYAVPVLPPRPADSHKGDYGRVLIIGGSVGMTGAAVLAGKAALRSGAGLVTVATGRQAQPVVASLEPCCTTVRLPDDTEGRLDATAAESLLALAAEMSCVACGPGLGRSPQLNQLVQRLSLEIRCPLLLDADGIVAFAESGGGLPPAGTWKGARIWTPHAGEFAKLSRVKHPDRQPMENAASQWAARMKGIVVLKGHRTWITDGTQSVHNETGNPGMATGGTGDVLTGVIAALIAQRLTPWDACVLGCHVHGLAGDLAADELGQVSLIASDLIDWLPSAFAGVEPLDS